MFFGRSGAACPSKLISMCDNRTASETYRGGHDRDHDAHAGHREGQHNASYMQSRIPYSGPRAPHESTDLH